jgi:hypothetical protein
MIARISLFIMSMILAVGIPGAAAEQQEKPRPRGTDQAVDLTPGATGSASATHAASGAREPSRGWTVFATNYLCRGYYTTRPMAGQDVRTIRVFAAPGQYRPATLSIRTYEKMSSTGVMIGDLRCGANVLPAARCQVRRVQSLCRWLDTGRYIRMEYLLRDQAAVAIPAATTQRFWLTVHVPHDARPGVYRGPLAVQCDGRTVAELTLEVEVLPIKLAAAEGMSYFEYFPPHLPKYAKTKEYQRKIFDDMRAHGMTTATAYQYPYPKPDGTWLNLDTELGLRNTLENLKRAGLPQGDRPLIWIGTAQNGDERIYGKVLGEVKKAHGPELLLYVIDEPETPDRQQAARAVMARIAAFRRAHPEWKVRTVTAIGDKGIAAVGDLYDVWICAAHEVTPAVVERARRGGKELWSYICNLCAVDAVNHRYYYGYWAWAAGVKGCANWAYADPHFHTRYGNKLTWETLAEHEGEYIPYYCLAMPEPDGPVPTIGWEAVREGIDDYRYLLTLRQLIDRARRQGRTSAAEKGEKVLQEVTGRIDVAALGRAQQWALDYGKAKHIQWPAHFDRPPPQDDLALEDYDRLRYKVALAIVELSREAPFRQSPSP